MAITKEKNFRWEFASLASPQGSTAGFLVQRSHIVHFRFTLAEEHKLSKIEFAARFDLLLTDGA